MNHHVELTDMIDLIDSWDSWLWLIPTISLAFVFLVDSKYRELQRKLVFNHSDWYCGVFICALYVFLSLINITCLFVSILVFL